MDYQHCKQIFLAYILEYIGDCKNSVKEGHTTDVPSSDAKYHKDGLGKVITLANFSSDMVFMLFIISEVRLTRQRTWPSVRLSVPLYTAAHLFSSFKSMRLSPDTFLKSQLDYHYFGLAVNQRDFTL